MLDRNTGLDRGFQLYDSPRGFQRDGAETTDRAIAWLKEAPNEAAFLWVHLYDAHMPYHPPAAFCPDEAALQAARSEDDANRRRRNGRIDGRDAAHLAEGKLLYAAEVAYVDALVGRLLDRLRPQDIVVAVADHGESLDEQGYFFNHGGLLHEPALHVPLIVRWSGVVAPNSRFDGIVATRDVAPMLLRAAGGSHTEGAVPLHETEVRSFTSGQQNRKGAAPASPALQKPKASLRGSGFKVVATDENAVVYDLVADPGELSPQPVDPTRSGIALALETSLRGTVSPATADEQARLWALGYVEEN